MKQTDITERLEQMDIEALSCRDTPLKYKMVIAGSSGLALLGAINRSVHDIDAIDASVEIRSLLKKYDAALHASAYICNFPYNYEDRLFKVPIGGRKIEFYTVSLEDIVVSKLFSSREQDRQDLVSSDIVNRVNWDLLRHLAYDESEVKAAALNDRAYLDFLYDFNEYNKRYGSK